MGDLALLVGNFKLAEQCFIASKDLNSLLMFYSACSNRQGIESVGAQAEEGGKLNVAF